MSTELLEIQPQEIKFIIESKKQCSCSVRLVNKTNQHVAFKVITSPRKYRVRPNTGVLNPKGICDFTVTMQAQLDIPLDLICKDKFLLQCAMVVAGTTEEDITSVTVPFKDFFTIDIDGKYVEGKKLGVILVSPPSSITLSPVNERLNQVQSYEVSIPEDQNPNSIENLISHQTVTEDAKENKKDVAEDLKPIIKENTEESMQSKDVVHEMKDELISKTKKDLEEILKDIKDSKPLSVVASKLMDGDELKLVKEIEEVKSKIIGSESKLNEAERKISKLTEEKRLSTQDRKIVQQELVFQKKEASTSTSKADGGDNTKLTKFNSMTLIIDSAKGEEIQIDSDLIEGKSSLLKTIFECGRESGKPIIFEIDGEKENHFKSLLYFLHKNKLKEEIKRSPSDIYGLLVVADKYGTTSCIKECGRSLKNLDMIEEVALLYLDPWSILMMTDVQNYGMIRSAKQFFMNKFGDFDRFPEALKTKLSLLEKFLVDKFSEIQSAPEKFDLYMVEAVLESSALQIDSEDDIYDLVVKWSEVQYPYEPQRIQFLSERIHSLVRFVFMSRAKLIEAKFFWKKYPLITNKISHGLLYHSLSSFGTYSRFEDYKKNRLEENEVAAIPYEQKSLNLLQVKEEAVEFLEERLYKRRPTRVSLKNGPLGSCYVYMELRREHCSQLLINGTCPSQIFYPFRGGVQGFVLSARCIDKGFALVLERHEEGPESIQFDCRFYIFSKKNEANDDYTLLYETRYSGQPITCKDFLPWLDLMDQNSPFFWGEYSTSSL